MSEVQLSLTPVAALPDKPHRAGPVGRPSPYTPVLDQIRAQGPGQAYRITAEPLPTTPDRAAQIANRIRNGGLAGVKGGEFDARAGQLTVADEAGHVFVEYVGAAGVAAYDAKGPEREARKAARAANKAKDAADAPDKDGPDNDAPAPVQVDATGVPVGVTPVAAAQPAFASAGVDGW